MNAWETVSLQILSGQVPFLTKGPWALYFGGEEILEELSNAKSGRLLMYLYLISIIFNVFTLGTIPNKKSLLTIEWEKKSENIGYLKV